MSFGAILPLPNVAQVFLASINAINGATSVSNDASRSGYTIVDKYLVGAIIRPASNIQLQVTAGTTAGTLNDVFIGQVAVAGNAYDFDGGQVRVTWNGGSSSLSMVGGNTSYFSDEIAFTIDQTKAILVAYNIGLTSAISRGTGLTTDYLTYIKAAVQEAGSTVKVTGYSATSKQTFLTFQVLGAI